MSVCVECRKETITFELLDGPQICYSCDMIECFGCKHCDKDIRPSEYYRNNGYCDNCKTK